MPTTTRAIVIVMLHPLFWYQMRTTVQAARLPRDNCHTFLTSVLVASGDSDKILYSFFGCCIARKPNR
jgi:hypothetical protein